MINQFQTLDNVKFNHVPNQYKELFNSSETLTMPYQNIVSFILTLEDLKNELFLANQTLCDFGFIYICYPKLRNRLNIQGIHRDHLFSYLGVDRNTGYVSETMMRFNQMRSFDEDYSTIIFKKDLKMKERPKTSQRVNDYLVYLDELKNILKPYKCYDFFNQLTTGYQKNWARYIFSAKTKETKEKRIQETIELLNQKIKSKNLIKKE